MIKKRLKKFIPPRLLEHYHQLKYKRGLRKILSNKDDLSNLLAISEEELKQVFSKKMHHLAWGDKQKIINELALSEIKGGVNKGDQRAIFYLIHHFKPEEVLEIGTHVGNSTLMIGLALKIGASQKLTTVDIVDVNDKIEKHWSQFGSPFAPLERITRVGLNKQVTFITSDSTKYLSTTKKRFDFIFLDGNHDKIIVLKEIILALKCLNRNGLILLHDYYPQNKPLWENGKCISGPYQAVELMKKRAKGLKIIPLGNLPWETKFNSNKTSLAILTKEGSAFPKLDQTPLNL